MGNRNHELSRAACASVARAFKLTDDEDFDYTRNHAIVVFNMRTGQMTRRISASEAKPVIARAIEANRY